MHPLHLDLDYILESLSPFWEELRNQHLFITGGTGFFGCWLLESFIWVNETLNLNAKATVLTRNFTAFQKKYPHLANHPAINFHIGDVKNFVFPPQKYSHIIHAATDTTLSNPLETLNTIIQGTQHTLEFIQHTKPLRSLVISSGAVYGRQPADLSHLTEDYSGKPLLENSNSAYGIGKCVAEHLCHLYNKQYGVESTIARCFAFVGPYLPLDAHFAIGNFLKDAIDGNPIRVNGDGTPYRSYLYAADLMVWLWKILFSGQPLRPYNVGSDQAISIAELARLIAKRFSPEREVLISHAAIPNTPAQRYIPDTTRARTELGLTQRTSLEEAIKLTIEWNTFRTNQKIKNVFGHG